MPKFRGPQQLAYVTIRSLKYGWRMNQAKFNGIGAALGIKTAVGVSGVFFGANSPKPGVARKISATGIESSFFDPSKAKTLRSAGWTLSNNDGTQGIRTSGRSVTVAVPTPRAYQYAWNISSADRNKALALGAIIPTDPSLLVWGSFPKPPRAVIREATGSFSTFIPPDEGSREAALKNGYSVTALDPDWTA